MPFKNPTLHPFNRPTIEAFSDSVFGVYGLLRQGDWIYVGKGSIRQRLLDHLNGDNPCITRERPTHWMYELTSNMDEREQQLIIELKPKCNQRIG